MSGAHYQRLNGQTQAKTTSVRVWKRTNDRRRPWWASALFQHLFFIKHIYIYKHMEELTLPALTLLHFPNYIWEMLHWMIWAPVVCPIFFLIVAETKLCHRRTKATFNLFEKPLSWLFFLFKSLMQFHGFTEIYGLSKSIQVYLESKITNSIGPGGQSGTVLAPRVSELKNPFREKEEPQVRDHAPWDDNRCHI